MISKETKICLLIYLFLAIPGQILFSFITPIFHVPDEPPHFIRAYQLTTLNFFPQKQYIEEEKRFVVGGLIDENVNKLDRTVCSIAYDKNKKLTPELQEKIADFDWQKERWVETPSVSIYPPFFYVPAALGIALGKRLGLNIVDTVTLTRLCNVLFGAILALSAIYFSGRYAFFTTFVFLLPMVMSQMGSASQDAIMFPVSALVGVFLTRLQTQPKRNRFFLFAGLCCFGIFLLATSRPPYAALSLLILPTALLTNKKEEKISACFFSCMAIVMSFGWAYYVANYVSVPFGRPGVDYFGQINFILSQPFTFLGILFATLFDETMSWASHIVGVLGWMEVTLPGGFYYLSTFAIGALLFLFHRERKNEIKIESANLYRTLIAIILFGTFLGLLTTIYIVWTPVGKEAIEGFQGRYLIPLVFMMTPLLICSGNKAIETEHTNKKTIILVTYGTIGVIASLYSLYERFYTF